MLKKQCLTHAGSDTSIISGECRRPFQPGSPTYLGCDDPFLLLLLPSAVALPSTAAAGGAIVTAAAIPTVAVEEDGSDGSRKARLVAAQQASRITRPRPRRAMVLECRMETCVSVCVHVYESRIIS